MVYLKRLIELDASSGYRNRKKLYRGVNTDIPKPMLTEVPYLSHTLSQELPGSQGTKASRVSSQIFPTAQSSLLGAPHFLGFVM